MEVGKTTIMYAPVIEIKGREYVDYGCICFLRKDCKAKFEKETGLIIGDKTNSWRIKKLAFNVQSLNTEQ